MQFRETYVERLRRLEMDNQIKQQKCKELEEKIINLDRKKFQAELRAKETEDKVIKVSQSVKLDQAKTTLDK